MFKYVDTHCHLDLAQFQGKISQVLSSAHQNGVDFVINPAIHLASSYRIAALSREYSEIFAAIGIHPNDLTETYKTDLVQLESLTSEKKVCAIGEIGLDTYHHDVDFDLQVEAFKAQLDLAAATCLPVIVHSRETMPVVETILIEWARTNRSKYRNGLLGVLHAFEGDAACAIRMFELGFLIGIGGPITYKNADKKRGVVSELPMEAILLETDSPYLSPEPHRGKTNEPAFIPLIGQRTAIIKGCSEAEVADRTTKNAISLFNIGVVY